LDRFIECWDGLDDPRTGNAALHDFHEILAIAMCAVLCGGQTSEPLHAGSRPPEPPEPCAPANPANRASPSMLASFPANRVNHDSPPLENPSNRFCLFGTRSSSEVLLRGGSLNYRSPPTQTLTERLQNMGNEPQRHHGRVGATSPNQPCWRIDNDLGCDKRGLFDGRNGDRHWRR
jgi:hypothetical protein